MIHSTHHESEKKMPQLADIMQSAIISNSTIDLLEVSKMITDRKDAVDFKIKKRVTRFPREREAGKQRLPRTLQQNQTAPLTGAMAAPRVPGPRGQTPMRTGAQEGLIHHLRQRK